MQIKKHFHPIQKFYGEGGEGWDVIMETDDPMGLTYFSFWEGLLWPASALNCALFPESKKWENK